MLFIFSVRSAWKTNSDYVFSEDKLANTITVFHFTRTSSIFSVSKTIICIESVDVTFAKCVDVFSDNSLNFNIAGLFVAMVNLTTN
jgi:hypothetical protein